MRNLLSVAFVLFASVLFAQGAFPTVATYAGAAQAGLVDGPLEQSRFQAPYGICHDPVTDDIYVADTYNHCIRRIRNGEVSTVAGNGTADDVVGQGTAARFDHPTGVFFKNGFLYIADNLNCKIKRMDADGNVTTIAGSGVQGFLDGPAAQARFSQPKSIVVDDAGTVFVADYENHRIRKIQDGMVTTYAGTGSASDGVGPALSSGLHRPRDLCLDAQGNLYIADMVNNKIKVVRPTGGMELVAGSGAANGNDGMGAQASFNTPPGIEMLENGTMVVVDGYTPRVRTVSTSGEVVTIAGSGVAGFADGPSLSSRFSVPQDICSDNAGNIYVSDRSNNRIRILRKEQVTEPCTALAGMLTAVDPQVCLDGGEAVLEADIATAGQVPDGYSVRYVLSRSAARIIEQVSSVPSFTVHAADSWYIHALVYDPATLDLASITLGTTTAGEVHALFVQGGGSICGSIDLEGAAMSTVECSGECTAYAGAMAADIGPVCLVEGEATLTAVPNGAANMPPGYQLLYILSRTNGLIIEQTNAAPLFTVAGEDVWRIHALVYDPAALDPSMLAAGTYLYDLQDLLLQGGGSICASLDISGAPIKTGECPAACEAQAANMMSDVDHVCLVDGVATLTAVPAGPDVVPSGYQVAYLLSRTNALIIEQVGTEPSFTVGGEEIWRIHGLVYDPQTLDISAITPGTYAYDLQATLVQGGGTICASLDISGAPIKTGECKDPQEGPLTGVQEVAAGTTLPLAPNPAVDRILIGLASPLAGSDRVDLVDASGRVSVASVMRTANGLALDVSGLADGAWTVRVVRTDGVATGRFVKAAQ